MKIEVKKIDSNKREISVEVSGDVVKNKFDDVFKRISQEARVPGFRPGHAPRDVLEKRYSAQAHEQVVKELVPDIYNQAIEKEKLDVIELPEIFDVKLDRNSLSFKARLFLSPEIKLKSYRGIQVNYKKNSVSADEIKRSIDGLKESRKVDVADDRFAHGLGYPNMQELQNVLERQIAVQKDNLQRQKIESEVSAGIIKDMDFKVPFSLFRRQLEDLVRQAKFDLALKGVAADKIKEEEKDLSARLEPEAERQVKIYLVLAQIARKEGIPVDDAMPHRVIEFLLKEAEWKEEV